MGSYIAGGFRAEWRSRGCLLFSTLFGVSLVSRTRVHFTRVNMYMCDSRRKMWRWTPLCFPWRATDSVSMWTLKIGIGFGPRIAQCNMCLYSDVAVSTDWEYNIQCIWDLEYCRLRSLALGSVRNWAPTVSSDHWHWIPFEIEPLKGLPGDDGREDSNYRSESPNFSFRSYCTACCAAVPLENTWEHLRRMEKRRIRICGESQHGIQVGMIQVEVKYRIDRYYRHVHNFQLCT